MFTIKPERGPVTDKFAVHKSGFRHFYHYAMTEAYNHIKDDAEGKKLMSEFKLNGVPVGGTKLRDVKHKIVIVLNDYDGGMDGDDPDVDLGNLSRMHSAAYHGVSNLAQGASHVISQGASVLGEMAEERALG